MTGAAGRRQGGDFLPLNRLEEEYAILAAELLVFGLADLCSLNKTKMLSPNTIEMYTSLVYKMRIEREKKQL